MGGGGSFLNKIFPLYGSKCLVENSFLALRLSVASSVVQLFCTQENIIGQM